MIMVFDDGPGGRSGGGVGGGLEDDDDETELWGELAREVCRCYPLVLYITIIL